MKETCEEVSMLRLLLSITYRLFFVMMIVGTSAAGAYDIPYVYTTMLSTVLMIRWMLRPVLDE